jgi:hypothetical protein
LHPKRFGIVAVAFVALAFLAQASFVLQNFSPVFFGLSLVVATVAALKGDRWYTVTTIIACLACLVLFSIGSVVSFHREEDAAWRYSVIAAFLAPIAALFFAAVRSRVRSKSYLVPALVLLLVLTGFQVSDLLKLGTDRAWQRGRLEPRPIPISDQKCFSTPEVSCVLGLAEKEGLSASDRVRISNKLATLPLEAEEAMAAMGLPTKVSTASCKREQRKYEGTQYGRARFLAIDAIQHANADRVGQAVETLESALSHARHLSNGPWFNPDYRRDKTLALIAPLQAAVGLEDAALETVLNIKHAAPRNAAMRDIAVIKVHASDKQEALLQVWSVADEPLDTYPSVRARALGDVALAIGSHSAIPHHQSLNWCALKTVYSVKCGISCSRAALWSAFF